MSVPHSIEVNLQDQTMSESLSFNLELEQRRDREFRIKFDWPEVDDLLLDEPEPLGILAEEATAIERFDRCLARFEDLGVVTKSVRHGTPVGVRVVETSDAEVFAGGLRRVNNSRPEWVKPTGRRA